jgi:hypothetical protein
MKKQGPGNREEKKEGEKVRRLEGKRAEIRCRKSDVRYQRSKTGTKNEEPEIRYQISWIRNQ